SRRAPAFDYRVIGEAERDIARHGDPLAERWQRRYGLIRLSDPGWPCQRNERLEIAGLADHAPGPLEKIPQRAVLARLHGAEVPLRQREGGIARHDAEDLELGQHRPRGIGEHGAVARTSHAIEDHPCDGDVGPMLREALEQGGDRPPLTRAI